METKGIVWAMKNTNLRLENSSKWLVWDEATNEWVVYHRERYARTSKELYRGKSETDAVKELCWE